MSGVLPLTRSGAPPEPDEVSIQVGNTSFQGWQSVSITRSVEVMPNSFSVSASTEFMRGPGLAATRPEQPCNVFIGDDLVITGWIDRRTIAADGRGHQVNIIGRGITRNLLDCSADLYNDPAIKGGNISAASTLDLARRLCNSFKLKARLADGLSPGLAIPSFQVGLGETPYQIIESVARYAAFLVYEDENGTLVLDRVGTQSMASGFTMPGNIESIVGERSCDGRYSDYVLVRSPVASLAQLGDQLNLRGYTTDPEMKAIEYRPLIIVFSATTPLDAAGNGDVTGAAMANWEYARRLGRSQSATITCDSWRDSNNKLWTPNWLAPVEAPEADITGANWIIGTVTFRKDMSGTHADLVLMPPEAFSPEPNPLNLFDAQLAQAPPASQNPAPPSTGSSGSGP